MLSIKSIIVSVLLSVFIVACTSNKEVGSNAYYGKWTLTKVVYDDGDFKDLSNKSGHFISIGKTEVSDVMNGLATAQPIQRLGLSLSLSLSLSLM